MIPAWLHLLSIVFLAFGVLSTLVVTYDLFARPQRMWIMNLVWPLTALFGCGLIVWFYFRHGRAASDREKSGRGNGGETPFPIAVAKGALHCGSGCTLGDIVAETLGALAPAVAIWVGWQWLFSEKIFAMWIIDYIFAFAFGIVFQYFTIAPIRGLGFRDGMIAAIRADTLSLTAWQGGMYGFMAAAHFWLFGALLGVRLDPGLPEFWFMMQIAMLAGFLTAYPMNWWLIRSGAKEAM